MSDMDPANVRTAVEPVLRPEELIGRIWRFGGSDGAVYAPHVRLMPDGRMAGLRGPQENRWIVEDGRLRFLDDAARRSTTFDQVEVDAHGRLRLAGLNRDGWRINVLQEIETPAASAMPTDAVDLRRLRPLTGRRNLVVLRANEQSLHPHWPRDLEAHDRSWDLCISFYGAAENLPVDDFAEYAVLQNQDRKFGALEKLFHEGSPLWQYDYISFPDDDLMMKWSDLNVIFEVCREYRLELAQPSLHPSSVINYHETRQNLNFVLRFVTLVEVMMPVFSTAALKVCAPTFKLNVNGFGIDYAWPRLIGAPPSSIAIIDKVAVLHTRFTEGRYDHEQSMLEGRRISGLYGLGDHFTINEIGGVYGHPMRRWPEWR
jgi:hypothetical protein